MSFSFGSSFGTTTTSAPSFNFTSTTRSAGSGFGTSNFNFGAPNQTAPSFSLGTSTATTNTGFSLGGLSAPASTASTGFGFGTGFGTAASTASTGFGFGTQPTSTFSGFGTGTPGFGSAPSTGFNFSSFGTTSQPAATTTSLFSGFSGFGQPATTTGFGFGSKLGATTTAQNAGFGFGLGTSPGFGQTTPGFGQTGFGQPQQTLQQQQQQQILLNLDPIYSSVFNCSIYGDERDEILSKFNLLQACWGTGKGYYANNVPPVEYTPQNPLCRFKAIAYSKKPSAESKKGFIVIQFNKKDDEIRNQESQLITSLVNILGKQPNLTVNIDSVRPLSYTSTIVFVYVEMRAPNGQLRRVPNTELMSYFLQPGQKQQLTTMGVVDMYAYSVPTKEQIQEYLENSPAGIDPKLWKQAQVDNPDPEKYIPVLLFGFNEIRWRYHCQIQETKKHQAFLDKIAEEIANLQRDNEAAKLRIIEYRHKVVDLEHRVLKVLVRQEVSKNYGTIGALKPEEEILRSQLDTIQSQLNSPQFKGRLSELLSQIRMHKQEASQQETDSYTMTSSMIEEIKQFLNLEQSGIRALIEIMKGDMIDMKILKEDLYKITGGVCSS